jgi:hypothetical protein
MKDSVETRVAAPEPVPESAMVAYERALQAVAPMRLPRFWVAPSTWIRIILQRTTSSVCCYGLKVNL